jgi:transposase InsO family protein
MQLTLKPRPARRPRHSVRAQELAFDRFRHSFSYERPHEALGRKPPAKAYEPSLIPFGRELRDLGYDVELSSPHDM